MKALLQLRVIGDIRLFLRREEYKKEWPELKESMINSINNLKAEIKEEQERRRKQELERIDQECRKQRIQAARRCQPSEEQMKIIR